MLWIFILRVILLNYYLINFLKTLPQSFHTAQSRKKLWRPALRPRRFESRWLVLFSPPPTYAHTILIGGKLSAGGKDNRRRKNSAGAGYLSRASAGGPKIRKKNRKNLTVPKIVAEYQKYHIPYLNTLRDHSISLYITKTAILIHCRNIPCLNTWPEDPSRHWARVGCYSLS